jgi:hypothetical protein
VNPGEVRRWKAGFLTRLIRQGIVFESEGASIVEFDSPVETDWLGNVDSGASFDAFLRGWIKTANGKGSHIFNRRFASDPGRVAQGARTTCLHSFIDGVPMKSVITNNALA